MAGIGRTLHCMLITAVISFTLGAYCQHYDILRQLCYVISDDPYAFHIRDKLYGTVGLLQNLAKHGFLEFSKYVCCFSIF